MQELLSSCCAQARIFKAGWSCGARSQSLAIVGCCLLCLHLKSQMLTCRPDFNKIVCRQSREEHDAHVAALGKEDKEMEEVFYIPKLYFILTSLVLHEGAGAQFGRAQAAGCRQAEPGAAPRKPLQEHQPWGNHRSEWTKRSLLVLFFAEKDELYHFRVKKGRQP